MTFFDGYSYKVKNRAMIVMAVLLIAVAYKRAFSVTIETRGYRSELEQKLVRAESAEQEIRQKQFEIARLNRYLGEENNTVEKVQQGFLNFFAQNAEDILVHQIDEVLNFKHPDFAINTHCIVIKGGFLETLKFLYALEKDFALAKILNISFEFRKGNNQEDPALFTTLLIQNYLR
ncbi:MAG: hypothetical protein NXI10_05670 [bacterium]|nr:hypothetical protein [bacterium]